MRDKRLTGIFKIQIGKAALINEFQSNNEQFLRQFTGADNIETEMRNRQAERVSAEIERRRSVESRKDYAGGSLEKRERGINSAGREPVTNEQRIAENNIRPKKINRLNVDLRKAVNKPPKTVVEYSYHKRCHKCNIDSVKEKLEEKSEFLRDTTVSIFIFLLALTFKNNVSRNDIVNFIISLWNGILSIGNETIKLANDAGMLAYKIQNETISAIIYWIIMILVILLVIALIAVICYWLYILLSS